MCVCVCVCVSVNQCAHAKTNEYRCSAVIVASQLQIYSFYFALLTFLTHVHFGTIATYSIAHMQSIGYEYCINSLSCFYNYF